MPISGRPWLPTGEAAVQRARAMFKQSRERLRYSRLKIRFVCSSLGQRSPSKKGNHFVQHGRVAGGFDEVDDGVGQPEQIVGDARAHAAPRRRMPPVLHVAFDELARGGAQQVLARDAGVATLKRHHILELVAETIGAAQLIERGARPDAARERLIEQPAIQH